MNTCTGLFITTGCDEDSNGVDGDLSFSLVPRSFLKLGECTISNSIRSVEIQDNFELFLLKNGDLSIYRIIK